jgi:hypothetical protein
VVSEPAANPPLPTTAEAIQEAEAWAWSLEGFEGENLRMAKEADAEGRIAAATQLHKAVVEWHGRAEAMRHAVRILKIFAAYEPEIRALVTKKRTARAAKRERAA